MKWDLALPITNVDRTFTAASDEALDLLNQFLLFDPCKRISARDALNHPYLTKPPLPCSPSQFLEKVKTGRLLLDSVYSTNQQDKDSPLAKRRRYSDLGKRRLEF